ncbi:MAG: type IX secretion system sortase PorU [Bacteroidales bacterium]|nr:type IX secretion system sortase PorU [Bacteroidales bacterium]
MAKKRLPFLTKIIIIFFALFSQLSAQDVLKHFQLNWKFTELEEHLKVLSFDNASFGEDFSPYFEYQETVSRDYVKLQMLNAVYQPIDINEESLISFDQTAKQIESNTFRNGQLLVANIKIYPFRRNPSNQQLEKLTQFDISMVHENQTKQTRQIKEVISASKLSEGEWFKFGITSTNIYKITYQELVQAGAQNINFPRLYGNGGKILPESNIESYNDDLVEIPIHYELGSDGIFNEGDYFVFYAEGPVSIPYSDTYKDFWHRTHYYTDTISYFIRTDNISASQIATKTNISESSTPISVFLDHQLYENNEVNLLKSGKLWLGEEFNTIHPSYSFQFNFNNIVLDSLARIHTFCAGRCGTNSYLNVYYNGGQIQSVKIPSVTLSEYTSYFMRQASEFDEFAISNGNINITVSYDHYNSATAWLDYIGVSLVKKLVKENNALLFTNVYQLSNVHEYLLSNVNNQTLIWDVTNINQIESLPYTFTNYQVQFKDYTDKHRSYAVFNVTDAVSISSNIRPMKNQNLHALENIEYVIVSPKNFITQANQIAQYHQSVSGLNTVAVTKEQVYNEFSSGTPDVTAIKNFMRYLYFNRSHSNTLKYLMLFGDGSYDNKRRSTEESNLLLTYQSDASINVSSTYLSDDYFGLLDDSEFSLTGYLDIGIGRLVIDTKEEADNAVKKILNYRSSQSSYGPWRTKITFAADNGDGNLHINDADDIASYVEANYPKFNINKVYIDAFPLEESSGGDLVPDATHAFNTAVENGSLIMNYTGHGGELGLAHEQLITNQDILSWNNFDNLATFITATCEFTRYDDEKRTSAGEYVFLNPNGGGIAMFTTTRIAYAAPNKVINTAFYQHLFDDQDFRMGDLIRRAKNAVSSSSSNMRIFTLIGDPALSLAIPKQNVSTTKIAGISYNLNDTFNLRPLQKVEIEGKVTDLDGQILSNFNGTVYPTIFDKPDTTLTLCQLECSQAVPFKEQKNIIYRGKASVTNGLFKYSFVVPKDISYKNGLGRISYYSDNLSKDGWGYNSNIGISGEADTSIKDNKGPEIEMFINDENFIFGGTSNENPIFIANLYDENGINTVGNGIGHDLTAVLDQQDKNTNILNTYYEADLDSYQSGTVKYPYSDLSEGKHSIYFKAWDVFNNSSEQTIEFYVANSLELSIENIFNYPNPFTTSTDFYFDHNQPNKTIDVIIQIFTVSGKLVKTLESTFLTEGFRSEAIHWDGKDDFNDNIGRGVYIYKVQVKTEDGQLISKYQKLVILK